MKEAMKALLDDLERAYDELKAAAGRRRVAGHAAIAARWADVVSPYDSRNLLTPDEWEAMCDCEAARIEVARLEARLKTLSRVTVSEMKDGE
jgi:hypothetical protein